jgi:hypothetical protein
VRGKLFLLLAQSGVGINAECAAGRPSHDSSMHYPLLLLRFWKEAVNMTRVNLQKFYNESIKLIPREGVSVTRLGGSSGTMLHHSQKQLFEFLARRGSFPRKASAVKFVQRPLYLQCLYISPYSGKPTHHAKYSPVHHGGAFKPTTRLVKVFPFLYDFAEAKIISALVGHPVGYHQDTFTGQQNLQENKMGFVVPKKMSMGRGGAGPTNYVVALLDW